MLARAVQLICLHRGVQVAHTGSTENLLNDLGSFRPTWLLAVPQPVFTWPVKMIASVVSASGATCSQ